MTDEFVYVVDDDDDLRRSLQVLVETRGGWRTRTFSNGETWLAASAAATPGCVILDLFLPGLGGLEVLRAMAADGAPHQTVVLTGEGNIALAVQAMRAGAIDFLEKPVMWPTLENAITDALNRLRGSRERESRVREAQLRLEPLSSREREVMFELIHGLPNKIIAHRLGLSTRTIETHRANIMQKTGFTSVADMLRCAYAAKAIELTNGVH